MKWSWCPGECDYVCQHESWSRAVLLLCSFSWKSVQTSAASAWSLISTSWSYTLLTVSTAIMKQNEGAFEWSRSCLGIPITQRHCCELHVGIGRFFVLKGKFNLLSAKEIKNTIRPICWRMQCLNLNNGRLVTFSELRRQSRHINTSCQSLNHVLPPTSALPLSTLIPLRSGGFYFSPSLLGWRGFSFFN